MEEGTAVLATGAAASAASGQAKKQEEQPPLSEPEASPTLPSVIQSPLVHSPPPPAQAGKEPFSGVVRGDSLDSIGEEEEKAQAGGEGGGGNGGGVHRPFRNDEARGRRRSRGSLSGSGSPSGSGSGSESAGSSPSSPPLLGVLPPTPVGAASSPSSDARAAAAPLTIVLVGGFLLPPAEGLHTLYWGEALAAFPQHRLLCVHPGPIASLHDRWVGELLCFSVLRCLYR